MANVQERIDLKISDGGDPKEATGWVSLRAFKGAAVNAIVSSDEDQELAFWVHVDGPFTEAIRLRGYEEVHVRADETQFINLPNLAGVEYLRVSAVQGSPAHVTIKVIGVSVSS